MSEGFKSVEEKRRHGLAKLVNGAMQLESSRMTFRHEALDLEKHPFGLEISKPPDSARLGIIKIVGLLGTTEASVANMCYWIADSLLRQGSFYNKVNYLRIILAGCDPKHPERHDVYFEIGTARAVLMCGGCTDFSGQGGRGKQDMEAVFSFLSYFYGVAVETVEVPYAIATAGRQLIEVKAEAVARTQS